MSKRKYEEVEENQTESSKKQKRGTYGAVFVVTDSETLHFANLYSGYPIEAFLFMGNWNWKVLPHRQDVQIYTIDDVPIYSLLPHIVNSSVALDMMRKLSYYDYIQTIWLSSNFQEKISTKLPIHLKSIDFGDGFNARVHADMIFPEGLCHVRFGQSFQRSVKLDMTKLETLTFGDSYARPLRYLPPTLKFLKVGKSFSHELTGLPSTLERVCVHEVCYEYKSELCKNYLSFHNGLVYMARYGRHPVITIENNEQWRWATNISALFHSIIILFLEDDVTETPKTLPIRLEVLNLEKKHLNWACKFTYPSRMQELFIENNPYTFIKYETKQDHVRKLQTQTSNTPKTSQEQQQTNYSLSTITKIQIHSKNTQNTFNEKKKKTK